LSRVVLKCLAPSPSDRYQSADELIVALFRCAQRRRPVWNLWLEPLLAARRFAWPVLGLALIAVAGPFALPHAKLAWTMARLYSDRYLPGSGTPGSRLNPAGSENGVAWSTGASRIVLVTNGAQTVLTDAGLAVWNLRESLVAYSEWSEHGFRTTQRLILFDAVAGTRKTIFEGPYSIQNAILTTSTEGEPVIVLTTVGHAGGVHGVYIATLEGNTVVALEPADLIALQPARITVTRSSALRPRPGTSAVQAYAIRARTAGPN